LRLFRVSRLGHLSGFTQNDDGVYSGSAVRLVQAAIAHRNSPWCGRPEDPSPGTARSPGRNTAGRKTTGGSRTCGAWSWPDGRGPCRDRDRPVRGRRLRSAGSWPGPPRRSAAGLARWPV